MNRSVTLWLAVVAILVVAGVAVYYAMNLAGESSLYRTPTTPTPAPATATDALDQTSTQNTEDLQELNTDLNDYTNVDPTMDESGI